MVTIGDRLARARTFLFVPADRPDRYDKAVASGADAVILDLEDAVQPSLRPQARDALTGWLAGRAARSPGGPLVLVRVNAVATSDHQLDVEAASPGEVDAIVVPKFGDPASVLACSDLHDVAVVGVVETAHGLLSLSSSLKLPPAVRRLGFGAIDFSADIGVSPTPANPGVLAARCQLVWVSAALGLCSPIDTAFARLDDHAGLATDCALARSIGYHAKFCIHPAQLGVVTTTMTPDHREITWAEAVVAAWDRESGQGRGALRLDGEMVDEAVVKRARQVLDSV